jgi:hypothetical protein
MESSLVLDVEERSDLLWRLALDHVATGGSEIAEMEEAGSDNVRDLGERSAESSMSTIAVYTHSLAPDITGGTSED